MTTVIRAIEHDGAAFVFTVIPQPVRSQSTDVLVRVERTSLNRGELSFPWQKNVPAGWDAYGIVTETSSDGNGPAIGTRVATWSFSGAWSEYRVVANTNLAVVPDDVSDGIAAALPVVGLTASRALRQLDLSPGASLLVTGATGGVGHLAVQIARKNDLRVTAVVRNDVARHWLNDHRIIADDVIEEGDLRAGNQRYDAAIDTVGGNTLEAIIPLIRPDGNVLLVGSASGLAAKINTGELVSRRLDLLTFNNYSAAGIDLSHLFGEIKGNRLILVAADGGDWRKIVDGQASSAIGRGKLTLKIPHD